MPFLGKIFVLNKDKFDINLNVHSIKLKKNNFQLFQITIVSVCRLGEGKSS